MKPEVTIVRIPKGSSRAVAEPVVPVTRVVPKSLSEAIEWFLRSIQGSDMSRATYSKSLRLFERWVKETGRKAEALEDYDLIQYVEYLKNSNPPRKSTTHKVNTINLYLSVLHRFYAWMESKKYFPNIAYSIEHISKDMSFKQHLTPEQANLLIEYFRNVKIPQRTLRSGEVVETIDRELFELVKARNYAIVNLMLRSGLRTIEVSRAQIQDIKEKRGRKILMVQGKGRVEKSDTDFVILSDKALEPINNYLELRGAVLPSEPLFRVEGPRSKGCFMSTRAIQDVVKTGMRAIGLEEDLTPHCLRHTTGVLLLLNGCSLYDVQTILRHRNPGTTEIYLKSIEADRRLENAPDLVIDNVI